MTLKFPRSFFSTIYGYLLVHGIKQEEGWDRMHIELELYENESSSACGKARKPANDKGFSPDVRTAQP